MSTLKTLRQSEPTSADSTFYPDADWAEMSEPEGPLTRPMKVSTFSDTRARTVETLKVSLIDMARVISETTARSKGDLPLLSFGRYGKSATEKGSLRHKANLKRVYGVEGDYDEGIMPPEEAASRLAEAGIAALVYTTPSHGKPEKGNRWRVIVPLDKTCEPAMRGKFLARVDAVLGHVLSPESYRASQSFFYGGEAEGAPVETFLVPGGYVDGRSDLDDQAIDLSPMALDTPPEPAVDQSDMPSALEAAQTALISATDKVRSAEPGCRTDTLYRQAFRLGGFVACQTLDRGEVAAALFEAAQDNGYSEDYGDDEIERHLEKGLTDGVMRPTPWSDVADKFEDLDEEDEDVPDLAGLTFDTPDAWASRPARDYVLKGLIAPGQHGCIFGEPGAGKSVIAPRLAYAVAQGEPFFGMRTKAGSVFYIACEDEEGMGARIEALRREHGDAPGLKLVRGCSDLFSAGEVAGRGSPQLEAIRRQAKRERPTLIVIDTLAMSAPGLEENASDGMGRINAISSALAQFGAAVIWVHHGTKAEGNTPRGHSSFNGRLDFSLLVRKADQDGIVRASLPKNRLGPTDRKFAYRIEAREVGVDIDGAAITAPFCVECKGADIEPARQYSPSQRVALAILHELAGETDEVDEATYRAVLLDDRRVCGSDNIGSKKKAVTRAIQFLANLDSVQIDDGVIRLCPANISADDFEDFDDEP